MISNRPRQALLATLALAAGLLAFLALWPSLFDATLGSDEVDRLLSRFTDSGSIAENSEGRFETAIGSLQLTFTHPLGMGSSYAPALEALTGYGATHNALLQLAVFGGPLLCLLRIGILLSGARWALSHDARTEDRVALYFLFTSMFEALFFQSNDRNRSALAHGPARSAPAFRRTCCPRRGVATACLTP